MQFVDDVVVDGKTFHVQVDADPGAGEGGRPVSVTVDSTGSGRVARFTAEVGADDLLLMRDVVGRALTGIAHLMLDARINGLSSSARERQRRIRVRYPKAWTAWTPDDDEVLRVRYAAGVDLDEIGAELGRRPTALVQRLLGRGLVDPDRAQALFAGLDAEPSDEDPSTLDGQPGR